MYKSTKNSEGCWVVENEVGDVVELCETRAESRRRASELTREALAEPIVEAASEVELSEAPVDVAVDSSDTLVKLESSEPVEEPNNMADVLAALKQFEQLAQPVEPPETTVQVVKVGGRVTKSSQVRARIAIAKQNNEPQDVVVKWTIDTLGMAKSLARVYVKGNWDRVPN